MALLDVYESGLGYRALRVETSGEAELLALIDLFENPATDRVMKAESTTLRVVVSGQPPWRIEERPPGVVTWTVSASQRPDILGRIANAKAHPGQEVLLNEEYEDLVVELVHRR